MVSGYDVEYEKWQLIVEMLEGIQNTLSEIRDRLPEPRGFVSLSLPPIKIKCDHELHATHGPNGDYILWCAKCQKEIHTDNGNE